MPFLHVVPGELQGAGPAGLGGDHGHAHLLRTHLRRGEGRQSRRVHIPSCCSLLGDYHDDLGWCFFKHLSL